CEVARTFVFVGGSGRLGNKSGVQGNRLQSTFIGFLGWVSILGVGIHIGCRDDLKNRGSGEKKIQRPSNYLRALPPFFLCRRVARVLELTLACSGLLGASGLSAFGQSPVLTLDEAIRTTAKNNRSIREAELKRKTAADEVSIARTYRLPSFSLTALGSQPL